MLNSLCPVDVRVLPPQAAQLAIREMLDQPAKLLVLASRGRCKQLNLTPFLTALQGDGHAVQLYTDIPVNPDVTDVSALLMRLREEPFVPTAILAIGGGSCIDLGKAASALVNLLHEPDVQAVREAIHTKAYLMPHACVDLLAMPTTAGTGSEVTRWATIWDEDMKQKRSIDHPQGYPKGAVIVPEWTLDIAPLLTLSTGLDALSHAMEAYWAVARNPISQELALEAARKVCDALPLALAAPGALEARRDLCMGSLLAGLAFAQTRTTACHSISYPLTFTKGIPHGLAVAATLWAVMRRNADVVPEIEQLAAVFDEWEGFHVWLDTVTQGVQPIGLAALGVTEPDLETIAELAFTAGRMDNNPIVFTHDEVMDILRESL